MLRIDFISDINCPWCALGLAALDAAIQQLGDETPVEIHCQPFELNPQPATLIKGQSVKLRLKNNEGRTIGWFYSATPQGPFASIPGQGQDEGERVLGDRVLVRAGGKRHGDAVLGGGVQVHRVVPDPGPGDDLQPLRRRGRDHRPGVRLRPGQRGHAPRQLLDHLRLGLLHGRRRVHELDAGGLQDGGVGVRVVPERGRGDEDGVLHERFRGKGVGGPAVRVYTSCSPRGRVVPLE